MAIAAQKECRTVHASPYGTASLCFSSTTSQGYSLLVQTSVNVTKTVEWQKDSWNYLLQDAAGNTMPLRSTHCKDFGNSPGTYEAGKRLILSFSCESLPRALATGDTVKVIDFSDQKSGADWLIFQIPIDGYEQSQGKHQS